MLTGEDLGKAVASIVGRIRENGIFVGSIRDYDALLRDKPPYIRETELGRRVSFQTRTWSGDCCRLTQYIIDDEHTLEVNKFEW